MITEPLTRPAPGWLASGARVYAIGDVHGCDGRLAALHRSVAEDLRRRPVPCPLLVHLGDYVDRGPESAQAVRRLASGAATTGCPMVCLRGNHEQMLLDALSGKRSSMHHWLTNGAEATLRSWGTRPGAPVAAWRAAMAPELPFLHGLKLHHQVDGYVFVHAGLRPGTALADQATDDMLWIREGFLDWNGPLLPEAPGVAAVHGHTPSDGPEMSGQRIGIDTGAVAGGALTCAVLEGRRVHFLVA